MGENVTPGTERTTRIPASAENMPVEMGLKAEDPFTHESHTSSLPESGKKSQKGKATEGGGSFKEQPYTFLAPHDPILINCT
jgi:hypothetical protein